MEIKENISLRPYNTMGIEARCRYFAEVSTKDDLEALSKVERAFQPVHPPKAPLPSPKAPLFLGGGSNILLLGDFEGLVIRMANKGIEVLNRDASAVKVRIQAGEVWADFVAYTIEQGWWGVENMSGIPGSFGGAVVQNMGAYGQEISRVLESVEVFDTESLRFETITAAGCDYAYRSSRFKRNTRYIVWSAVLNLCLKPAPCLEYAALAKMFEDVANPSQAEIAQAVLEMRRSKLPDVKEIGSVGSFFTNPVVSVEKYEALRAQYPDMPAAHGAGEGCVKLSAAWLIDRSGWKAYREGDAGVYPKQPLVLVNYGRATGREIWSLAGRIQSAVRTRFNVDIHPEVCVVADSKMQNVFDFLDKHGIKYECYYHPESPTIEIAKQYWRQDGSVHCKNLFFRNHKGNRHYLVCFDCDKDLAIHDLEHRLHQGKLSFASEQRMDKYLGLKPGSVSPFGLINDVEHHVHLFLDAHLQYASALSFHPNDSRATVVLSRIEFERYLSLIGNTYEYLELY